MTEELEHQLRDNVRYALQAHDYQRPRTRDCEVRDAYFTSVADAIIRQIKLSWTFEAPDIAGRGRNRRIPATRNEWPETPQLGHSVDSRCTDPIGPNACAEMLRFFFFFEPATK
jgi:hypothetical protein